MNSTIFSACKWRWLVLVAAVYSSNVFAATSTLNNNFRVFEDTLWLTTFILMIVMGLKFQSLTIGGQRIGYLFISLTGFSGVMWKGIGLVKRVTITREPKWFFDLTRETFEGLCGIILAIGFIILIASIRKVMKTT